MEGLSASSISAEGRPQGLLLGIPRSLCASLIPLYKMLLHRTDLSCSKVFPTRACNPGTPEAEAEELQGPGPHGLQCLKTEYLEYLMYTFQRAAFLKYRKLGWSGPCGVHIYI